MIRYYLIFAFLLLTLFSIAQDNNSIFLSLSIRDGSFEDLVDQAEKQTHLKVLYKPEWTSGITVNIKANNTEIISVFKEVLKESSLYVSIWNNQILILKDDILIYKLPTYQKKSTIKLDTSAIAKTTTFMKGRKADLLHIKIGNTKYPSSGKKISFSGHIIEATTGNAVEGATIYIKELRTGAVTDRDGEVHLSLDVGKYAAVIECMGMEKMSCQFEVISMGSFTIPMQKAHIDMKEFVVYGDYQMNVRKKDPGMEKVSVKTIKELPNMMGESDIIKISEMLPGVVSVGEGSAGINVRGGNFDQNAFYFNKIPIYNTSHMFGFFPAFNADVIDGFSIYKGYIPAKYGGKLSSIFDISTRTGNKKHYTAHGGISPIAGNLTIEGPIKKDTASFLVSGRTSYSDWILSRIDDYVIRNSKSSFYDLVASINIDLPKTQVNLFAYHSQDYFKLHNINTYWYSNTGGSATVGHNFFSKLRGDFSLSGVQYQFKTIDEQERNTAYEYEFKIEHYELKADFQNRFKEKHQMEFGLNARWLQLDRGEVLPYGRSSLKMPTDLGKERGLEAAVYVSDNYDITPLLKLNAGFRMSIYAPFGPEKVYTYYDEGPKDVRFIKDSIEFSGGQAIKKYYFPEFRLSLNYQTDEFGSVKFSFNQMHQSIFILNNTISIAPNAQWKLADYHLKPSKAYQFSLGIFRNIPRGGWEASIEVYYKNTKNYTEFKDGADFLSTPLVETNVLHGDQKSYGAEFLIKRRGHRIDGWLAYTFSRSLIQVDGEHRWDKINEGNIYPSNFDIPHVVNAIINYHISKRVTFSTIITYQTGKPITYPTSYFYIDEIPYLDYSNRNEYRIPDYFRTDISLTIQGNLRKKKILHSSFNFSVYNLTGRENPYSVYFTKDNRNINSYQYSVIGVPIFTATWIFKLGNYDAL